MDIKGLSRKILTRHFTHLKFFFHSVSLGKLCQRVQTAPAWRLALDVFDVAVRAETELTHHYESSPMKSASPNFGPTAVQKKIKLQRD